jgi:hypothetical protein
MNLVANSFEVLHITGAVPIFSHDRIFALMKRIRNNLEDNLNLNIVMGTNAAKENLKKEMHTFTSEY